MLEIGGPALFLRHVSASDCDNAFVNFDHRTWFPASNYVVMKLCREHYAPQRIALEGGTAPLNAMATKSADGKTLYVKAVNPSDEAAQVQLRVSGDAPGKATLRLIAPGQLAARNTLEARDAVQPKPATVHQEGSTLRFTLPPISCGVVEIRH